MTSVSHAGHEHHERIDAALDGLPVLTDMLDERPRPDGFETRYAEMLAFITGTLLPHMDVVEGTLYPEFDRLMQNRHSMVLMRRGHEDIGGLIARLDPAATPHQRHPAAVKWSAALVAGWRSVPRPRLGWGPRVARGRAQGSASHRQARASRSRIAGCTSVNTGSGSACGTARGQPPPSPHGRLPTAWRCCRYRGGCPRCRCGWLA